MNRAQFLGLLTLPFLTRFGKNDEPKTFPTKGSGPNGEIVKGDCWAVENGLPYKNYGIFIPQGRPSHFYRINNHGKQSVVIDGYQVTELGAGESIEITQ